MNICMLIYITYPSLTLTSFLYTFQPFQPVRYLSIYLSIYLSLYLSTHQLSIYLCSSDSIKTLIDLSIYLSPGLFVPLPYFHPSIYQAPIYLFTTYLPNYLWTTYVYIYLSITYTSIYQPPICISKIPFLRKNSYLHSVNTGTIPRFILYIYIY